MVGLQDVTSYNWSHFESGEVVPQPFCMFPQEGIEGIKLLSLALACLAHTSAPGGGAMSWLKTFGGGSLLQLFGLVVAGVLEAFSAVLLLWK